ncbi:hypothetical protein PPGU16_18020 [Paraburkholderia largidicola]|uniref:Uncharacterized protein n=1 Tax=Paraburkholderia largidicola TaxID=3014751 RepID=A0A7I8BJQ9_9BURK|nr:hypothetical protein PPGU16_18020 [Paraburkholderia sp. PGU16]
MTYRLSVTHSGATLISCPISTIYGRTLALFGLLFPSHLQERPQDAPVALGKLVRTIEDSLQEDLEAHSRWLMLCASQTEEAAVVDLSSDSERVKTTLSDFHGGHGGDGAWPAGGGGGGGSGPLGSNGGSGAEGAMLLFEYDSDGHLIDIEAFVLAGKFDWKAPPRVAAVMPYLFGGGGGGGGGAISMQPNNLR